MNLHERMEVVNSEYGKFELIQNPRSKRRDLHAFLLLDELVPADKEALLVSAAEHDVYYIDVDVEKLDAAITDEQVIELVRCGISYSGEYDCLMKFP